MNNLLLPNVINAGILQANRFAKITIFLIILNISSRVSQKIIYFCTDDLNLRG